VKLFACIAGLAAALLFPAAGQAGDQTYVSWTLGERAGRPTVTWELTGSSKWYVALIQVSRRRAVDQQGDFLPQDVVAYEALGPGGTSGSWTGPKLPPGRYYGRLELRYDGQCRTNCAFKTSIRSFKVDPPALRGFTWNAKAGIGRVRVEWRPPRNGWYVAAVVVDDERSLESPEDAVAWPRAPKARQWSSRPLPRGTYHVRVRLHHSACDTCVRSTPIETVRLTRTNAAPVLRPATFEITRRDATSERHWWSATFTVCDQTRGRLTVEIREQTGPAEGRATDSRTTNEKLAEPDGCRRYTVAKRSAFPHAEGTFVRVAIRVRDGLGAWSVRTRRVTWVTSA
jgi:hypothetical protein